MERARVGLLEFGSDYGLAQHSSNSVNGRGPRPPPRVWTHDSISGLSDNEGGGPPPPPPGNGKGGKRIRVGDKKDKKDKDKKSRTLSPDTLPIHDVFKPDGGPLGDGPPGGPGGHGGSDGHGVTA